MKCSLFLIIVSLLLCTDEMEYGGWIRTQCRVAHWGGVEERDGVLVTRSDWVWSSCYLRRPRFWPPLACLSKDAHSDKKGVQPKTLEHRVLKHGGKGLLLTSVCEWFPSAVWMH